MSIFKYFRRSQSSPSEQMKKSKYLVNNVDQLNQFSMQNDSGGIIASGVMSPEMLELVNAVSEAGKLSDNGYSYESRKAYDKLIARWPRYIMSRINFTIDLLSWGNHQEAYEQIQIAASIAPYWYKVHMTAATYFDAVGDRKNELIEYQKALADNPTHYFAMLNTGIVYGSLGQPHIAKEWFLKTVKCMDELLANSLFGVGDLFIRKHQQVFKEMAGIEMELNNYQECIYWVERAMEREPHDLWLQIQLQEAKAKISKTPLK